MFRSGGIAAMVLASGLQVAIAAAQHPQHAAPRADSSRQWSLGAMAIGVVTRAQPAAFGRTVTEGYVTQPMLFGQVQLAGGRLRALATFNAEGATLRRGEINLGGYGEGYIDRRHPHTWVHEVMVGAVGDRPRWGASLFAGKGFVPYGTDDPMVRPFVKYPVNHHHAQLLERVMVVGALRLRGGTIELARFNGDEPEDPADWPNASRALDSWAARVTARAPGGAEFSASTARVESPEFATGEGLDHRKWSLALRVVRSQGWLRYAMAEWAQTNEWNDRRSVFTFTSLLVEGSAAAGPIHVAARLERTERPEEDRLDDPYRSVRPALDFNILGRTRWDVATIQVSAPLTPSSAVMLTPFVEASWLRPRALALPTALDPVVFFDARRLWMLSCGVRVHALTTRPRWGRYGAAQRGV